MALCLLRNTTVKNLHFISFKKWIIIWPPITANKVSHTNISNALMFSLLMCIFFEKNL